MMLRTLRRRLIVSHILPLLVIAPLVGLALVYLLESQVLLPDLLGELTNEAELVAVSAGDAPGIWTDPVQAQAFVTQTIPRLTARLMLLSSDGRLLATSEPTQSPPLGGPLDVPGLSDAEAGRVSSRAVYSQLMETEVADAFVPVSGSRQQVVGIVRLTYRLNNVYDRFQRLRYVITAVLALGLLLGVGVGWVLALNLQRPLQQVTRAVARLTTGEQLTRLPERGPEEIATLAHAFNTSLERLQTLEHARRQLLANLVHELGTPLGALRSGVQALLGGAADDASLRDELLHGMDEEVGGLQHLLEDLVRHYDHVLGTIELNCHETDPNESLPRMLAPWQQAARRKGLQWEVTIQSDLLPLNVDRDALAQALGNLISNSIKYTPAGGTVVIAAGIEHGEFWIRVSDSGPGIPIDEQAHIFTPFYRGAQARRFPQGMGIGLGIARDLVVAHGGRLDIESAPGAGSQFTIRLPINRLMPKS
jgi:signal transduction histidine kinase